MPPEYVIAIFLPRLDQVELLEQLVRPAPALGPAEVVQVGHHDQVLPAGEQAVDRGELAGDADRGAHLLRVPVQIVAGHPDLAGVGGDQGGQDLHRRGLAGAVRAEQGKDGAFGNVQVDAVEHDLSPYDLCRPDAVIADCRVSMPETVATRADTPLIRRLPAASGQPADRPSQRPDRSSYRTRRPVVTERQQSHHLSGRSGGSRRTRRGATMTDPRAVEAVPPVGRQPPDLAVADLPAPEEVFGVPRLGPRQLVKFVIGPSLIALGISIGSGEWLLGPQAGPPVRLHRGRLGDPDLRVTPDVLQRGVRADVVATGEVPVVACGRVPPGNLLWMPLSVFIMIFAFIAGGSARFGRPGRVRAGARRRSRPSGGRGAPAVGDRAARAGLPDHRGGPADQPHARAGQLGHGRHDPGRACCSIDLFVVPFERVVGGHPAASSPRPRRPPGITATQLGALAGFTALASGLNWYVMGHYRDKGYGMGHRTGYISGLRGERRELLHQSASPSRTTRPNTGAVAALVPAAAASTCGACSSSAPCSACCCPPS